MIKFSVPKYKPTARPIRFYYELSEKANWLQVMVWHWLIRTGAVKINQSEALEYLDWELITLDEDELFLQIAETICEYERQGYPVRTVVMGRGVYEKCTRQQISQELTFDYNTGRRLSFGRNITIKIAPNFDGVVFLKD